jgi:TRAP-type C4-dicarboxylate transport system permease large subunit
VHLGIIFLTNLELGYLTPPVGLIIITAVPWLSLWLVDVLGVR